MRRRKGMVGASTRVAGMMKPQSFAHLKMKGLALIDLDGTLLLRDVKSRANADLEPLGTLPERGIGLALQSMTPHAVMMARAELVADISLPVDRLYNYHDLKIHSAVKLTQAYMFALAFKRFQLAVDEWGITSERERASVVNVEDYDSFDPDIERVLRRAVGNDAHLIAYLTEREQFRQVRRTGQPLPLSGGHLPAATILIPAMTLPNIGKEKGMFVSVTQMVADIIEERFSFAGLADERAVVIDAVGACWLYYSSPLLLNELFGRAIRLFGEQIPELTAWREQVSPPQRFLFYLPESPQG